MAFTKLGVSADIIRAITEKPLEWILPTDVQDEAIPLILGGGDVMVAAVTGSGKTAAFGIPVLQIVYETLQKKSSKITNKGSELAKIIPQIKLSEYDKDDMFVITDTDSLLEGKSAQGWNGIRANVGIVGGKYYFEVNMISGLGRIGFSTKAGSYRIGVDNQSYGYGGTGKKSHNKQYDDYGEPFGSSDVIGCYIDYKQGKIGYTKNGRNLGIAFRFRSSDALYPTVCVRDYNRSNGLVSLNFGATRFKYKIPNGFKPMQNANINDTHLKYISKNSNNNRGNRGGSDNGKPLALIIAPTRDLAQQLYDDINKYKKYLTNPVVNTCLCIGGGNSMIRELKSSHVVIGTCGMLVSLITSKKLSLDYIKFFIIDEADRVLDSKQGQQDNIKAMFSRMPGGIQVMLFSATLHSAEITKMSKLLCHNPQWVDLKGKEYVPDTVHHCILGVDSKKDRQWQKHDLTQNVITDGVHRRDKIQYNASFGAKLTAETMSESTKLLKPIVLRKLIDAFKPPQCLIFCRTRLDCDNLESYLTSIGGGRGFRGRVESGKENPYSCCVLHSGRRQDERKSNLLMFKEGECRFLICTDVAARGIDIKNLPFVINFTMPAESEDYIHRVGRVGRAEKPGIALSILSPTKEKVWYHSNCNRGKRNGVECTDTRLTTQGGCCIWYNEIEIFKQVEKRLGGIKIPTLDQKSLQPKIVEKFVKTIQMKDPLLQEAKAKVKLMIPKVNELNNLEQQTQIEWLSIQNKISDILYNSNNNNNNNNNKRKRKRHRKNKNRQNSNNDDDIKMTG